jgi:hypothetical protein
MLRSNPSARADARAWAAMLFSLLILALHARADKAVNLPKPLIHISPTSETPWLPYVKICRGRAVVFDRFPVVARFASDHRLPYEPPPAAWTLTTPR